MTTIEGPKVTGEEPPAHRPYVPDEETIPEFTWGAMVAQGQSYLGTAWWVAFWPGLAITLTAMSLNLLANWVRIASDPVQRWRLESRKRTNG